MDGYAVRSSDSGDRRLIGSSFPGRPFAGIVGAYEAVRITTGASLPAGADAVVMLEEVQLQDDWLRVSNPVTCGRHVIRVGEDVSQGTEVLPAGRVLRPQDVGLLASIGVDRVPAVRQPRVALIVTGNEILPPGSSPAGDSIIDSNSPMLSALIRRDGGIPAVPHYCGDDPEAIRAALLTARQTADLIFVTGGTSVGAEDYGFEAVASLGELAVRGVALRPGRPTGVAFLPQPVILIPGQPVACLAVYDVIAGYALRRLSGRRAHAPYRKEIWPWQADYSSPMGRTDYVRVRILNESIAAIDASGASRLSSTVRADGFVLVPEDCEGYRAGELAEVHLYD